MATGISSTSRKNCFNSLVSTSLRLSKATFARVNHSSARSTISCTLDKAEVLLLSMLPLFVFPSVNKLFKVIKSTLSSPFPFLVLDDLGTAFRTRFIQSCAVVIALAN